MANKIRKKLRLEKEKELNSMIGDKVLNDAKTLLLNAHNDDLDTLEELGLDHQIKYERKHQDDINRATHYDKIYKTESFSGKQIKRFCKIYDMRLLPTRFYNGNIPVDLARKVREFCEEHKLTIRTDNFYILAPVEHFNTDKKIKNSRKDPILFYKDANGTSSHNWMADETDMFTHIHDWGDDFSELRRFRHWFNDFDSDIEDMEFSNFDRTLCAIVLFGLSIIISLFGGPYVFTTLCILGGAIFLLRNAFSSNNNYYREWNTNQV